jgi:hypothetical protein
VAGESSVVNVLVGEGLANVQAVAQANLRQPRYTDRVRTNDRDNVDVEPLRRWRRPRQLGKQQLYAHNWSIGVLEMACTHGFAAQIGDPLATKVVEWTKQISRSTATSGSDVAIVSDDPAEQHNPLGSQGPLDGNRPCTIGILHGAACRDLDQALRPILQVLPPPISLRTKIAAAFPFEAVLGKTHHTEF